MSGLWIESQDGTTLTYCRTIKVWEKGRVVNHLGKEYVHLGDYESKERAKAVLQEVAKFMSCSNENRIFKMPIK